MSDGKNCPECGKDIGYWAVAKGLFVIRCPHCRARLQYAPTPRWRSLTGRAAVGSIFLGIVLGPRVRPAAAAAMLLALAAGLVLART